MIINELLSNCFYFYLVTWGRWSENESDKQIFWDGFCRVQAEFNENRPLQNRKNFWVFFVEDGNLQGEVCCIFVVYFLVTDLQDPDRADVASKRPQIN